MLHNSNSSQEVNPIRTICFAIQTPDFLEFEKLWKQHKDKKEEALKWSHKKKKYTNRNKNAKFSGLLLSENEFDSQKTLFV